MNTMFLLGMSLRLNASPARFAIEASSGLAVTELVAASRNRRS